MVNNRLFHNNKGTFRSVIVLTFIMAIVFAFGMKWQGKTNQVESLTVRLAKAESKPIEVVYIEPSTVESYIKYVFGNDAPKAFMLLKGDGSKDACAENRTLNPDALNDNTSWGGKGKDWGVFQINDKWQGVQSKFLLNYKVNIQIAHQLFEENGKSFKLWTCGKVYGI